MTVPATGTILSRVWVPECVHSPREEQEEKLEEKLEGKLEGIPYIPEDLERLWGLVQIPPAAQSSLFRKALFTQ